VQQQNHFSSISIRATIRSYAIRLYCRASVVVNTRLSWFEDGSVLQFLTCTKMLCNESSVGSVSSLLYSEEVRADITTDSRDEYSSCSMVVFPQKEYREPKTDARLLTQSPFPSVIDHNALEKHTHLFHDSMAPVALPSRSDVSFILGSSSHLFI